MLAAFRRNAFFSFSPWRGTEGGKSDLIELNMDPPLA